MRLIQPEIIEAMYASKAEELAFEALDLNFDHNKYFKVIQKLLGNNGRLQEYTLLVPTRWTALET